MISVFADERQYSDDADERAEARTAIAHENAKLQLDEEKYIDRLYGAEKKEPEDEA